MPAAIHNFVIEQGSNFYISFEYLNTNNLPVDLTDYCVVLKFRNNADPTDYAQYSSNVTNASYKLRKTSAGIIEWILPFTETQTFNFDSANYDLLLTNNNTEEYIRLCTGTIQIIKTNFPECNGTGTDSPCKTCDQISFNDAYSSQSQSGGTTTLPDSITLVAPFSGIISSIAVTGGQIVNTSDALITINRVSSTGSGGSTGGGDTGGGTGGGGDSPTTLSQEDLCDYLCQGLDLFGKLYKYSDNIYLSSENSGNIPVTTNQTSFTVPSGYISGLLDVYLNSSGLIKDTNFTANNEINFSLTNLVSVGRPSNIAISGDIVTWVHKGIKVNDLSSSSYPMYIANTGIINNLEITVNNLKHDNPQDLVMILMPPSGDGILLSAYNKINNYSSTSGLNFTFSNKATSGVYLHNRSVNDLYMNIYDKTSIYNMSHYPVPEAVLTADLSSVNGLSSAGYWSLLIQDQDAGGSGTIDGWNMIVTYPPTPFVAE
jgi:subtilisin-like proprotein convertase family protein